MEAGTLKYGSEFISYSVAIRPKRRTLGIEVHPDGRVVVLAPESCSESTIKERVRLRAAWISRQLAQFSRYERWSKPRQYLSGESHLYLGRQYRLRVISKDPGANGTGVQLKRGMLIVSSSKALSRKKVQELLQRWYADRAIDVFNRILGDVFPPFAHSHRSKPFVRIRQMKRRWGSLSARGQMTLNLRLIQAPRPCIEYVIVHELCHLSHHHHGPQFLRLLRRVMPDWEKRKSRLEEYLL